MGIIVGCVHSADPGRCLQVSEAESGRQPAAAARHTRGQGAAAWIPLGRFVPGPFRSRNQSQSLVSYFRQIWQILHFKHMNAVDGATSAGLRSWFRYDGVCRKSPL